MRDHPLGICNLRVYVRKLKPVNDPTESRKASHPLTHFPLLWVTEPFYERRIILQAWSKYLPSPTYEVACKISRD